jgi:hypothetical protein
MKDYGKALEWLEAGRSVVWKQMLQLRTPMDELAEASPILASELQHVAHELDRISSPKASNDDAVSDALSLEQAAQNHRRLALRWDDLLDKARALPGFENFLLPLKASQLMRSAQSGPVVMINMHKTRCDALVIQPGVPEILHVPLQVSYDLVAGFRLDISRFVRSRDATQRAFLGRYRSQDMFARTLAGLWKEVVRPVIDSLGYLVRITIIVRLVNF